jgi:hypothetical protein
MRNLPLKPIKPNVPITDWQWFVFLFAISVLIIILSILIYKKFFAKKPKSVREIRLEKLQNLDFNDSKKTAYEFTRLAKYFLTEENEKLYERIVKKLEKYKYKRQVPAIDEDTKKEILEFVKGIK